MKVVLFAKLCYLAKADISVQVARGVTSNFFVADLSVFYPK
jgi:hypothetical protein